MAWNIKRNYFTRSKQPPTYAMEMGGCGMKANVSLQISTADRATDMRNKSRRYTRCSRVFQNCPAAGEQTCFAFCHPDGYKLSILKVLFIPSQWHRLVSS